MQNNTGTLFLFTDIYPYDLREAYVGNEVWEYHKYFKRVVIIPINVESDGFMRQIPDNCEVVDLHKEVRFSFFNLITSLPSILSVYLFELGETEHKVLYLKNFTNSIKVIYNATVYAKALNKLIGKYKVEKITCCSYWFYHWSLVCAIAKRKGYIKKYYSRAHLNDLYELKTKINFTNFKLDNIETLFAISEDGKKYYKDNYPNYVSKVKVAYLGTPKVKIAPIQNESPVFLIVSCSSISAVKRVDEIFNVVTKLSFPVRWLHFGWGTTAAVEGLKKLLNQRPKHVDVELKGIIPNSELLKFYSENKIDLFINLSSEEGLPVSIMEAQSFGIPVLATDVFATREAVVAGTGLLVAANATTTDIIEAVSELKTQIDDGAINRDVITKHWNNYFNSENNYQKFALEITN